MPPTKFGRYEVRGELGDGAMGRVYKAWDPSVSRVVAVKTVKTEFLTSDTSAEYMKRFRREAQAAGSLSHPCVVRVYDVGDDFLVMEYVEGRTLQQVIRDDGRFAPDSALRLLGPVAEAIDFAHRAGIVHRDIKPANIMVQPNGLPKLMDFGVVHLETSVMTTAGQILGSPSYMSPEQIAGLDITGRSDVYSLAVVAYEMLTGQPPFQGTITQVIYRVMNDAPPPPRQWNAGLPARYDDVFAHALEKDPAKRFPTAGAFVEALDLRELELQLTPIDGPRPASRPARRAPAADDPDASLKTVLSVPPVKPRANRTGLLAALAAAGVLVVALAAWWAVSHRADGPAPATGPQVPAAASGAAPTPMATPSPSTTPTLSPSPSAASTTPAAPTPSPAASPPHKSPAATPKLAAAAPTPSPSPRAPKGPTKPPTAEGDLVELGPDVTPPVKVKGSGAAYPDRARRQHLGGTVGVSIVIDENGFITEPKVVESAGPILDEAVLASLSDWRFEPARKDGVRVKVRWLVRQTYKTER